MHIGDTPVAGSGVLVRGAGRIGTPARPAVPYFPPPAARCTADLIALVMTLPMP